MRFINKSVVGLRLWIRSEEKLLVVLMMISKHMVRIVIKLGVVLILMALVIVDAKVADLMMLAVMVLNVMVLGVVMLRLMVSIVMRDLMMNTVVRWLLMLVLMRLMMIHLVVHGLLLLKLVDLLWVHVVMETNVYVLDWGLLGQLHFVRVSLVVLILVMMSLVSSVWVGVVVLWLVGGDVVVSSGVMLALLMLFMVCDMRVGSRSPLLMIRVVVPELMVIMDLVVTGLHMGEVMLSKLIWVLNVTMGVGFGHSVGVTLRLHRVAMIVLVVITLMLVIMSVVVRFRVDIVTKEWLNIDITFLHLMQVVQMLVLSVLLSHRIVVLSVPVFYCLKVVVVLMVGSIVLIVHLFVICDAVVLMVGRVVAVLTTVSCLEAFMIGLLRLLTHLVMMTLVRKMLIGIVRLGMTSHSLLRDLLMMIGFRLVRWSSLLIEIEAACQVMKGSDFHVTMHHTMSVVSQVSSSVHVVSSLSCMGVRLVHIAMMRSHSMVRSHAMGRMMLIVMENEMRRFSVMHRCLVVCVIMDRCLMDRFMVDWSMVDWRMVDRCMVDRCMVGRGVMSSNGVMDRCMVNSSSVMLGWVRHGLVQHFLVLRSDRVRRGNLLLWWLG